MADMRHNPDLDAVFNPQPPKSPPPANAQAGEAGEIVGELGMAVDDLVGATDDLDAVIEEVKKALGDGRSLGRLGADGPHPSRPNGDGPPVAGTVGGDEAETVRQLVAIKELLKNWYKDEAAKSRKQPSAEEQRGGGPGVFDALRPLTDRFFNRTGVGRALARFGQHVRPHVEPHLRKAGKQIGGQVKRYLGDKAMDRLTGRLGKGSKGPGPGTAPKGGGGAGARAAGGEAAGARAAAGAGARGAGAAAAGGEGAAAGAAAGAEGAAGAAGAAGPVGIAIAVIIAAGLALQEVYRSGLQLAHEQEDHARKLAEFSAKTAYAVDQLDVNRAFRAMGSGDRTAGSTAELTKAIDKFERATQPLDELATNARNAIAAGFLDAVATIAENLVVALPILARLGGPVTEEIYKRLTQKDEDTGVYFGDSLREFYAQEQERQRQEAEARMRRLREINAGR